MSNLSNESEQTGQHELDWTVDPETGRINSSPEFLELAEFVGALARSEARAMLYGRTDEAVGAFIMAQLAHVKNVGPLPKQESPVEVGSTPLA